MDQHLQKYPTHVWECTCGERHKSYTSALTCRKCRDYLIGDWKPSATHLITGEKLDINALYKTK